jgi:hypothetical protein
VYGVFVVGCGLVWCVDWWFVLCFLIFVLLFCLVFVCGGVCVVGWGVLC